MSRIYDLVRLNPKYFRSIYNNRFSGQVQTPVGTQLHRRSQYPLLVPFSSDVSTTIRGTQVDGLKSTWKIKHDPRLLYYHLSLLYQGRKLYELHITPSVYYLSM